MKAGQDQTRLHQGRQLATRISLVVALATAQTAHSAALDDPSIACRATIAKYSSKLEQTTMKAFDGCIKTRLKDGAGVCNSIATADLQNKIGPAGNALTAAIGADCDDVAAAIALGEHTRCGVPDGSSLATFAQAGVCLTSISQTNIENLRNAILAPDFAAADDDTAKCINAIAKNATKYFKTIQKVKHKAIKSSDVVGADSDYTDPGDPDQKIAGALGKLQSAIAGACGELPDASWKDIGSCANNATGAAECTANLVASVAGGLAASSYDQPGVCPSQLHVQFASGAQGGVVLNPTDFDMGWTGAGHQIEPVDGWGPALGFDVDCGLPTDNACALCDLTPNCDAGNCRCENDNSDTCDEPFGPDADDCSGADCLMFFSPPIPTFPGTLPICMTVSIDQPDTSLVSFSSGQLALDLELRQKLHLGPGVPEACPTCEAGLCDGGPRDGLACSIDASTAHGDVSLDCPPEPAAELTAGGSVSQVSLGTATTPLGFDLPCDPPNAILNCACSACELDATIACNSNSDCGISGPCGGMHDGESTRPNSCTGFVCTDTGGGDGRCVGDEDLWCDGLVKGNGEGYVGCFSDSDCLVIPGAGNCTQSIAKRCFLDPIVTTAQTGFDSAVLGGSFCVPPTINAGLNSVLGLPGPGRLVLKSSYARYCSDGVTPWGTGGANCP